MCKFFNFIHIYPIYSYFPVFGLNTGKHGPEKSPYLDTFHAVFFVRNWALYTLSLSQYLSLFLIFFIVNPGLCWEKECNPANLVLHGY